jgi:hypothetical protein
MLGTHFLVLSNFKSRNVMPLYFVRGSNMPLLPLQFYNGCLGLTSLCLIVYCSSFPQWSLSSKALLTCWITSTLIGSTAIIFCSSALPLPFRLSPFLSGFRFLIQIPGGVGWFLGFLFKSCLYDFNPNACPASGASLETNNQRQASSPTGHQYFG